MNYDKVREVPQEKAENPSLSELGNRSIQKVYQHRPGVCRGKGHCLPGIRFTQSAPDMRRKLPKLEAGPQTPPSTSVEEALKVCNNRDKAGELIEIGDWPKRHSCPNLSSLRGSEDRTTDRTSPASQETSFGEGNAGSTPVGRPGHTCFSLVSP